MAETQAVQEVVEEIAQNSSALGKVGLLVGGIFIGASSGYYVAKRRLEKKYAKIADDEIEDMRELYRTKLRESAATRVAEVPKAEEIIAEEGYAAPPTSQSELKEQFQDQHHDHDKDEWRRLGQEEPSEAEITANVFPDYEDEWIWEYENEMRESGADPYVLHKDEWLSETGGYVRQSYTYFEGDDVLADEHDTPVDDQELMVGLPNLTKFGHGSGDPNVVYIRNVELQMEIEVLKSEGKFSEQQRGIVEPPTDPTDPRRRRNRGPH